MFVFEEELKALSDWPALGLLRRKSVQVSWSGIPVELFSFIVPAYSMHVTCSVLTKTTKYD